MTELLFQGTLILALLCFAGVIGWWLGRSQKAPGAGVSADYRPGSYYQGLNKQLYAGGDQTLASLISTLELLPESAEAKLMTANLMRIKGRLEDAIRLHQGLLSVPGLSPSVLHQARLELARDYIATGQLDRAGRLLQELLDEAPEFHKTALHHLMEIYQDQGEWQQAIDVGMKLLPRKSLLKSGTADGAVLSALSHYHCELAVGAMAKNDFHAVRGYLKQALFHDRNCVRASLLLGEAEYNSGHYTQAIKALRKISAQDPLFISESIVLLARCYEALGQVDELYIYLKDCMKAFPSPSLMLMLAEEMQRKEGSTSAALYLGEALRQQASQRGLAALVDFYLADAEGEVQGQLELLKHICKQLLYRKSAYHCQACGFLARHEHWLCPGCQQWGQVKPLQDLSGGRET